MPATPVLRRRRAAKSLLVVGTAPVFAMGAWLTPAAAAEGEESRAAARFLDGTILGEDLDNVVELAGVEVENLGDPDPVTEVNPVDVTVLDTINVNIPDGVEIPISDIIKLGAANQWATAEDGAVSHAATGAVADNGGVSTGVDDGFPADATFDLTDLLGEELTDTIADVELRLGAISSEAHLSPNAEGDGFDVERDYEIAGGELVITLPLLGDIVGNLSRSALNQARAEGVDLNLAEGTIVIDLDVIFEDLNNLPPNTELIGPQLFDIVGGILEDVAGDDLTGLLDELLEDLNADNLTDGLGEILAQILSVKVNVQPDQPEGNAAARAIQSEEYSVAAVQVTLLPELEEGGAASVTLAESRVGPNVLADGSETEVDGTETETEVDGTETEVDGTETETEVDGTETEVDGTEVDGTETEVDGTEVDGTETEVDGTEVDGTETETEGDEDGGQLPDTGAGSSQLLIIGLGLMLAGGIAAYAVSRRRGLTQE